MKKSIALIAALGLLGGAAITQASPQEDQERWQSYFQKRFPNVEKSDFANGVYAIDPVGREKAPSPTSSPT